MKRKCHECKHMRTIPGNCHVRCAHPSIKSDVDDNPLLALASLCGGAGPTELPKELNIKASQTGINGGWFMFPLNFDPTWLMNCDGFEEVSEDETSKKE